MPAWVGSSRPTNPFSLVEQQRAGSHRIIGRPATAQHEVQKVFNQQPLVGARQDFGLVLGHPQQPQCRAESATTRCRRSESSVQPQCSLPTSAIALRCAGRAS
jgi:hypothetical protein